MEFKIEESVPDYLQPTIKAFFNAIKAGWPSAALSSALIHVGRNDSGYDVIYFDIYEEALGKEPITITCTPDESPADIERKAHTVWHDTRR